MSEARRYRILDTLGRGAFGTVYRAEIVGAGGFSKQVALKVLNRDQGMPEEMALRLRDEARILGLLRHRAVVGVDSLADLGDTWGVVMEYVPGVDLQGVLEHGRPPARVCLEIVEEVASALHAAWATPSDLTGQPLRLVHRDIKPSNVRITDQGEVKVLDFGVARADFREREAATRSLLFGSMRYMAPERMDGIDGPEADVFALGIVLAQLVTGADFAEPPKNPKRYGPYLDGVLDQVEVALRDGPPPIEVADRQSISRLVEEMLAFEARDRPPAREVERRCRALRAGLPGPWLREWAEAEVPRVVASMPRTPGARDPSMPSVLVERSGSVSIHGLLASTGEIQGTAVADIPEPTRATVAVGQAEPSSGSPRPRRGPVVAAGVGIAVIVAGILVFLGLRGERPAPMEANVPEPDVVEATPAPAPPPSVQEPLAAEPVSVAPTPEPSPATPSAAAPRSIRPKPAEKAPSPPAEPVSANATVKLTGDARSVWLESASGRFPAGSVPPGTYTIKAWFDSPDPVGAGSVTLEAGESVTLTCASQFQQCRRK